MEKGITPEGSINSGRKVINTNFKAYSMYKPSGVSWLGNVPAHWEVRKLSQIGSLSKSNGR